MSDTPAKSADSAPLVSVEHLSTAFHTDAGIVRAVDDVSFDIPRRGVLGLVGESGSGKSVSALSIIRLISPPGRIESGRVVFRPMAAPDRPVVLTDLPEPEMRKVRGRDVSMIFQEPMTSLNPVFTVGGQIAEAVALHQGASRGEARRRAIDMLSKVGIPEPGRRVDEYPHQMSGGMRQRVMIAMALACEPDLLIADEPTTALDVTIQAQILDLLRKLQSDEGMSVLLITHDLGVVSQMADRVVVMYASKVVEQAAAADLFARPLHPYTMGLIKSRPERAGERQRRLWSIPGMVPSPLKFPTGCKFHPRCFFAQERCKTEEPALRQIAPGHVARCHFAGEIDISQLALDGNVGGRALAADSGARGGNA